MFFTFFYTICTQKFILSGLIGNYNIYNVNSPDGIFVSKLVLRRITILEAFYITLQNPWHFVNNWLSMLGEKKNMKPRFSMLMPAILKWTPVPFILINV